MGYVSARKTRLQTRLVKVQAQIPALEDAVAEAMASGNLSYVFDSGEGSQRTTRRSLKDMQDSLNQLYATEDHIINELYGMGLVSIRLRRKA
jgi:hypothetical protein